MFEKVESSGDWSAAGCPLQLSIFWITVGATRWVARTLENFRAQFIEPGLAI